MIKYRVKWGAEVYLDVADSETKAPLQASGNPEWTAMILERMSQEYGAFGHFIGSSCTASDLASAMRSPAIAEWLQPELIEGAELTAVGRPDIPDGAIT